MSSLYFFFNLRKTVPVKFNICYKKQKNYLKQNNRIKQHTYDNAHAHYCFYILTIFMIFSLHLNGTVFKFRVNKYNRETVA